MAKLSAGLLPFRISQGRVLEVLIVHPGGPLWAKRDAGSWSIAKGEYEPGQNPLSAAEREFEEELGRPAPEGERLELGELRQRSGKTVVVWAVAGDIDVSEIHSNRFEMEWPPKSGLVRSFPEVDRAMWCAASEARRRLLLGQVEFVERLAHKLRQDVGLVFNESDSQTFD
ncbi:MAG: putative pyrophosphohydrolase [Acidimicrobiaceae bacterium]|nr:putative pyrophosphohydrolase [Acidimicrobiaceae bacterium]